MTDKTLSNPPNSSSSLALAGLVAIVTGGGRGIGAATAEELVSKGARVLICSRTESELASTVSRIASQYGEHSICSVVLHLGRQDAAKTLFDLAEKRFQQPVQILVNNAAIGYAVDFLKVSSEQLFAEWEKIQAVNIRAPLILCHEFMHRLVAKQIPGSIVNLSSIGGIRSTDKFPGLAPYVMSKFAVCGMTEALAVEGRPYGIRVNAVAPGAVDTEMLRKAAPHLRTKTTSDDVAKVIVYLCNTSESGTISGSVLEIHSNL